jgi:hypothetical protein
VSPDLKGILIDFGLGRELLALGIAMLKKLWREIKEDGK